MQDARARSCESASSRVTGAGRPGHVAPVEGGRGQRGVVGHDDDLVGEGRHPRVVVGGPDEVGRDGQREGRRGGSPRPRARGPGPTAVRSARSRARKSTLPSSTGSMFRWMPSKPSSIRPRHSATMRWRWPRSARSTRARPLALVAHAQPAHPGQDLHVRGHAPRRGQEARASGRGCAAGSWPARAEGDEVREDVGDAAARAGRRRAPPSPAAGCSARASGARARPRCGPG